MSNVLLHTCGCMKLDKMSEMISYSLEGLPYYLASRVEHAHTPPPDEFLTHCMKYNRDQIFTILSEMQNAVREFPAWMLLRVMSRVSGESKGISISKFFASEGVVFRDMVRAGASTSSLMSCHYVRTILVLVLVGMSPPKSNVLNEFLDVRPDGRRLKDQASHCTQAATQVRHLPALMEEISSVNVFQDTPLPKWVSAYAGKFSIPMAPERYHKITNPSVKVFFSPGEETGRSPLVTKTKSVSFGPHYTGAPHVKPAKLVCHVPGLLNDYDRETGPSKVESIAFCVPQGTGKTYLWTHHLSPVCPAEPWYAKGNAKLFQAAGGLCSSSSVDYTRSLGVPYMCYSHLPKHALTRVLMKNLAKTDTIKRDAKRSIERTLTNFKQGHLTVRWIAEDATLESALEHDFSRIV